jgi:hypothetical protein
MNKLRLTINTLALMSAMAILSGIAQAQPTRTWVSSSGNDANTCSRTSPCATFNGAINKTAKNGEVNCLDAGSYGTLNITRSITIDCEDTQGTIVASFVNGIVINLGALTANDPLRIVRLRGLTINGIGNGIRGILVSSVNTAPVTVHVEQVVIDGFTSDGIFFNAAGGELFVRNTMIQNCRQTGANPVPSGVLIDSSNAGATVHATIENSTITHNGQGLRGETSARISVSNCNLSNNTFNGITAFNTDATQVEFNVYRCVIASNRQWGVIASANAGGAAIVRLDGNQIVSNVGEPNAAGVQIFPNAQVLSRGNNTIAGSPVDVQGGSLTPLPNM